MAPMLPQQEDFEKAAEEAKQLPSSVTNDEKLELYALFKQATHGDCDTGKHTVLRHCVDILGVVNKVNTAPCWCARSAPAQTCVTAALDHQRAHQHHLTPRCSWPSAH